MYGNFLGHNLLLSQASFSLTEFWLSQSLSHKLFSFFTMEFRLPRSPSHEWNFGYHGAFLFLSFFSQWNFGYHGAFLTNSFFFHDGTSAITEPFSRIFSFFTMELRLSRSLSHDFFLFSRWNFETQNTKRAIWGKTLFIYISERVFT
jgi:hypothetical protein